MNIWQKIFSKITFKDYPDVSTPLNATNLNVMTNAIDRLDDRVVESRNDIVKILGNMATEYDETSIYDVGSYVIYNGLLYKCINAISNAEEWDSSKWEKTDCGVEFGIFNSQVDELNSNLEGVDLSSEITVNKGEIVYCDIYKTGKYIDFTLRVSGVTSSSNTLTPIIYVGDYTVTHVTYFKGLINSSNTDLLGIANQNYIGVNTKIDNVTITISGRYRIN